MRARPDLPNSTSGGQGPSWLNPLHDAVPPLAPHPAFSRNIQWCFMYSQADGDAEPSR